VLPLLDIPGIRTAAARNARALETMLGPQMPPPPSGAAPFRVQLIRPTEASRDALLARLAAEGIFAPVHWRQERDGFWSGDDEAADLAGRILTLPVDHRCGPAEVHRLAGAVAAM
jgi:hypothetical protein